MFKELWSGALVRSSGRELWPGTLVGNLAESSGGKPGREVPALQEPANYGTDLETSVYESQIRSGYRILMHPFAVAFFNYYKMAQGQLVPNGWRKLVGLIYLVQTSGYPVTVHDFMRLYLEVCSIKNVDKSVGWPRAPTLQVPPLVVEDLPINKDPIFCPRWTIKRGDSGMPSSHVSAQHLAHGVLPSDKLILENQPHEAFAMAPVQAAYNAYCYSSQMQVRFSMAMDVARNAETDKRAAEGKADKLDNEVKNLKTENVDLLTKLTRLEKRCEKLRHDKAEIGNKAIQAFLDGTAGEEWLRKRTEDGLFIFQESFQKAKELTMVKYPSLSLDDIVVPTFGSPSGKRLRPLKLEMLFLPGTKVFDRGMLLPLRTIYLYSPVLQFLFDAPPVILLPQWLIN
ncbi:hypothetical protein RJ640_002852 [Escallonia rubra]|uniref:Transposase (putative) gypsy type domain-containing protein n=1 Tax=Escallonia rubra TaxID=112253 RepID=A0AA88QKW7_9ASTE|nr:hypothetical protein RJ640_002852 [Escallonia rubra]